MTYLVPLMIGARDMAFPRLNALSFWMLVFGGLLLYYSFVAGGAPDAGWFSYAPLSEQPYADTQRPRLLGARPACRGHRHRGRRASTSSSPSGSCARRA